MSYTIEQDDATRAPFGPYTYRIYRDGALIAHYWHDYRGDEHGIVFLNGAREPWPVGRMIDFVEGGGPTPKRLSARAIAYLQGKPA